jgi:ubiquinone/menaquinone biosynthesis C-methylase UbiE
MKKVTKKHSIGYNGNMNQDLLGQFDSIEKVHWWWAGRRRLVKLLLSKFKPYPKNILDVGCGTGETLSFLRDIFPKSSLYGVDCSPKAVAFSKARLHKKIFKASALKLPFSSNSFDAILFLDVLEHISEHEKALREAKRVLKPHGIVIITSPAIKLIWSEHDSKQGHKRRYSKADVFDLANTSGMKIKYLNYFNFVFSPPIMAIRLLSRFKMFRFLVRYNYGLNYDVARLSIANTLLTKLISTEVKLANKISYPFGISIISVFEKNNIRQ